MLMPPLAGCRCHDDAASSPVTCRLRAALRCYAMSAAAAPLELLPCRDAITPLFAMPWLRVYILIFAALMMQR